MNELSFNKNKQNFRNLYLGSVKFSKTNLVKYMQVVEFSSTRYKTRRNTNYNPMGQYTSVYLLFISRNKLK